MTGEKNVVYKGKYITVTEEKIDNHVYERARLRAGVQVIPYDGKGRVLLIEEYRVHEKKKRWKFVSGWIDKEGKSALEHAKEELAEEIGLAAKTWEEIFVDENQNATCSTSTHVFICRDIFELEKKPENPDAGEIFATKWFNLQELIKLIEKGDIKPAEPFLYAVLVLLREKE